MLTNNDQNEIARIGSWRSFKNWPWVGLVLVCCVAKPCLASAQEKSIKRQTVDELIRLLDAPTLSERSQAERRLLDLGPAALPMLPSPELIESVSARESVRRIRPQLERRAARESSRASVVALTGDFPIDHLLQEVQKQTGNQVTLEPLPGDSRPKIVHVKWTRTTFWESLDDLCQQGNLRWHFVENSPVIHVNVAPAASPRPLAVQRTGPFRLAIEEVERRPIVGEQQQQLVRVRGRLSIEPRLRPLFLSTAAADLTAMANENRPLSAWNPDARYEHPVGDGSRDIRLQWDFSLSEPIVINEIAIRGRIYCQIAASTERIVFDQTSMTRGTVRRRGGVAVRLKDVTMESIESGGLNAEIGVSVSYDTGGPAFESHRTWIFHNAVYLETKGGVKTSFTNFETTQQSDGAVGVTYFWPKLAEPRDQYRFVYEAPTLIINVPVEIDLSKIPVTDSK